MRIKTRLGPAVQKLQTAELKPETSDLEPVLRIEIRLGPAELKPQTAELKSYIEKIQNQTVIRASGLVVMTSDTSAAEDPGFESQLVHFRIRS